MADTVIGPRLIVDACAWPSDYRKWEQTHHTLDNEQDETKQKIQNKTIS